MFGRRITDKNQIEMMCYAMGYVDLNGNPVERPRFNNPYSYDEYVIKKLDWKYDDEVVYSDRLSLWYEDLRQVQEKHFGRSCDYYSDKNLDMIEKFLCELFEKDIQLTAVTEECNVSNGNLINLFYFRYL